MSEPVHMSGRVVVCLNDASVMARAEDVAGYQCGRCKSIVGYKELLDQMSQSSVIMTTDEARKAGVTHG